MYLYENYYTNHMKETFRRAMVTTTAVVGLGLSSSAFAQKAPLLDRMTELAYEHNLQDFRDLVPLGIVGACCGAVFLTAYYSHKKYCPHEKTKKSDKKTNG